eukprot:GILK01017475.1.p1 GENE.GILK01017475.1~~GILK01017475.1.p1  ORF type:complete len:372 (-),score=34.72 GILK01017475.1:68-1081(-)
MQMPHYASPSLEEQGEEEEEEAAQDEAVISIRDQNGRVVSLEDFQARTPCSLFPRALEDSFAELLLSTFLQESQSWEQYKRFLFGKAVTQPRLSQVYASLPSQTYLYGGRSLDAKPYTPELQRAQEQIEQLVNIYAPAEVGVWTSNFVVCNLYRNGEDGVAAHSDTLTSIGPRPTIASLSLGATRTFVLRRINTEKVGIHDAVSSESYTIQLPHNSLLIMWPPCQEEWRHAIVKDKRVAPHCISGLARLNFTFRHYKQEYVDRTPQCLCQKAAVLRCVLKQGVNKNRYFYHCAGDEGSSCNFFNWANWIPVQPSVCKTKEREPANEPSRKRFKREPT